VTLLRFSATQNIGGISATRKGPRNTAPSTKRSGKARAFLPSSGLGAERIDGGGDEAHTKAWSP